MGFQQRPSDSWLLFCCTAIFVFRFTFAFRLSSEVPQIDGWSSFVSPLNRCTEKIVSCIKNYTKLRNNFSHLLWKISFSFTPFNLQCKNKAVATEPNAVLWATICSSYRKRVCKTRAQLKFWGTNSFNNCHLFSANVEGISPCTEKAQIAGLTLKRRACMGRGGQHGAPWGEMKASSL